MKEKSRENGNPWVKATISLAIIGSVTAGIWAAVDKLDAGTIRFIAGFMICLLAMLVIGALLIAKDLVQAYVVRRAIREDDADEMVKMAFIANLQKGGGGRPGDVSVSLPPAQLSAPVFDGQFHDATFADRDAIEVH